MKLSAFVLLRPTSTLSTSLHDLCEMLSVLFLSHHFTITAFPFVAHNVLGILAAHWSLQAACHVAGAQLYPQSPMASRLGPLQEVSRSPTAPGQAWNWRRGPSSLSSSVLKTLLCLVVAALLCLRSVASAKVRPKPGGQTHPQADFLAQEPLKIGYTQPFCFRSFPEFGSLFCFFDSIMVLCFLCLTLRRPT